MKTITFDGTKMFLTYRENDGRVRLCVCENSVWLQTGEIRDILREDGRQVECIVKIEIEKNETFIALCRALISMATREELIQFIANPLPQASYKTVQRLVGEKNREKKGKKKDEKQRKNNKRDISTV